MSWILYAIFALSGATSLAFETLWFRQAGLTFGNSVWASSLVLSSFMAGMALGNGVAARYAARIDRPLVAYAGLEFIIACVGTLLVFTLPSLTDAVTFLLRPFFDQPLVLNGLRLALGFGVLVVPATAMGATLPLVVRAMHAHDPNFGSVLGRLYGVNTLGAVLGAVAGEMLLIERLGIRGSALFIGALGIVAALGALAMARTLAPPTGEAAAPAAARAHPEHRVSRAASMYLAAAFLAGAILLALEVVWFRFLHLFAHGGGLAFSLMLATVLLGIGLGGTAGGFALRRAPGVVRHLTALAFVSGCASVAVYAGFKPVIDAYGVEYVRDARDILWLTFCLTFAPSLLSGVLFTWIGAALEREVSPDSRATGLLTMANTLGAGLGSLVGGFVLLPTLGMELSFLLLAGLYGGVGLLLARAQSRESSAVPRFTRWLAAAAFVAAIALFPSGRMEEDYFERPIARYGGDPGSVIAKREGVLQTLIYLRHELDGETIYKRLITDGYSMSGTAERARRYMKLFVYWPIAVHPEAKRALLISYGVGETAKALTDTKSLEHIDVVDISPEILASSRILFENASEDPLEDPRVTVHTEDGRYFLKSTRGGYDLITGEPPPPKISGVISLYTREYFELVRERLNPGGLNTYWLPVHNLTEADSKAIIRAYCDVFPDCALWSGSDLDWMLTGSNGASGPASEADFARQWQDSSVAAELRSLGVDSPEMLGALFMAGPARLRELTNDTAPLIDDFPKRVSNELSGPEIATVYRPWMDARLARERFATSEYIRESWPEAVSAGSLEHFEYQRMLVETFAVSGSARDRPPTSNRIRDLHQVLSKTSFRFLVVRMLGLSSDRLRAVRRRIAQGASSERYRVELAAEALADRDYASAARHLAYARHRQPKAARLLFLQVYSLAMSGDLDRARALARAENARFQESRQGREFRSWLVRDFGL